MYFPVPFSANFNFIWPYIISLRFAQQSIVWLLITAQKERTLEPLTGELEPSPSLVLLKVPVILLVLLVHVISTLDFDQFAFLQFDSRIP
jgi:hypothetical protein